MPTGQTQKEYYLLNTKRIVSGDRMREREIEREIEVFYNRYILMQTLHSY